jgi:hypothetical protein
MELENTFKQIDQLEVCNTGVPEDQLMSEMLTTF